MSVRNFLSSAEFIEATIQVYDRNDTIVFESDGFSVNDPTQDVPSNIMNQLFDFWLLENNADGPVLKIFL